MFRQLVRLLIVAFLRPFGWRWGCGWEWRADTGWCVCPGCTLVRNDNWSRTYHIPGLHRIEDEG